jgi:alpha-tubulin suppressor-like RCC1 family protein
LPDACTVSNGHIAYLDDAKVPVIASNGTWIGFDGRTVGSFVENQLWAWGNGICGILGDGTTIDRCSPVREFCSATDWCQVSAGAMHTAAIKTSGELWSWGGGFCGNFGDGTTTTSFSPVREFCSATNWCQVSAGCSTAAIKTSGELWSWGRSHCGQLGDGTITTRCSPVRERCSATDWCQVSAGYENTAAIKTSGQLWAWGSNICGRLGDGTVTTRCSPVRERCSDTNWCQVSKSNFTTSAIKTSGQLWVWGAGECGRLGDGTTMNRCSPVREFCSATDWCQVSVGREHSSALKTSGQIWSWGSCNGRLGDGTTTNRCSPVREFCSATDWCQVSAGRDQTIAIKTSSQLWAWGLGSAGRLGDGTTMNRCSPVREFCSATDWCQVSVGCTHAAAIKLATVICR